MGRRRRPSKRRQREFARWGVAAELERTGAKARVHRALVAFGRELVDLRERQLYLAAGYPSFDAFVADRLPEMTATWGLDPAEAREVVDLAVATADQRPRKASTRASQTPVPLVDSDRAVTEEERELVAAALTRLGAQLLKMRDSGTYRGLGFRSFDEYAEVAVRDDLRSLWQLTDDQADELVAHAIAAAEREREMSRG